MARAIWSGAISFGLVNVPVKLYSATSPKTVRFHQLSSKTGARIRQKRVDPSTGEEVPFDEIVKGSKLWDGKVLKLHVVDAKETTMELRVIASANSSGDAFELRCEIREKLIDLFLWEGGVCTHYHGVAPPPSGFPLNIDGWDVLEEGVRRRVIADLERDRVAALRSRAIVPATGPALTAMRSSLPAQLKRFLSELDRPLTVPELVLKLGPEHDPEQLLHDALLLLHIGAVRFAA